MRGLDARCCSGQGRPRRDGPRLRDLPAPAVKRGVAVEVKTADESGSTLPSRSSDRTAPAAVAGPTGRHRAGIAGPGAVDGARAIDLLPGQASMQCRLFDFPSQPVRRVRLVSGPIDMTVAR